MNFIQSYTNWQKVYSYWNTSQTYYTHNTCLNTEKTLGDAGGITYLQKKIPSLGGVYKNRRGQKLVFM